MHPMLNVAVRAARAAGRIITRASVDVGSLKVARKRRNDFVTEVDHAAEEAIIGALRQAYPDHAFLGEESGYTKGRVEASAHEAEHLWIIDPLDGTTNFLHGVPQYCVSIALMQKGVVTQAVVYDPNHDEIFTASKGRGAFLNDRRIRVSSRAKLDEALIGTGFPFRKMDSVDRYMTLLKAVMMRTAGVRRPGAAALDLAWVAAGRYDGFFELGLAPWDVAAGSLLVSEAGGLIGNFRGDADYLFSEQVIAATPRVFSQMVSLFANPEAEPPAA